MTTTFPERVWEGGTSREATKADYARRRLIAEYLDSRTSDKRVEEILKELSGKEANT